VTNGEIMAFIADKGYQRPELWLSMGWDWVTENKVSLPFYWQGEEGSYQHFTLQGLIDVDPNTPACHLSYFEADALRAGPAHACRPNLNGNWPRAMYRPAPRRRATLWRHPPSTRCRSRRKSRGLPAQMFGDVWEWTQSNYNPYPGYKPWEGLVGEYNGKFMCNQFVLRGGSCATPQSHIRASYRNFFPPDARWQFSGLRLARDLQAGCPAKAMRFRHLALRPG
jgi:ergothioneine biosynthesis protein EgtB